MKKQRFLIWLDMPQGCRNEPARHKMIWAESLKEAKKIGEKEKEKVGAVSVSVGPVS